MGLHLATPLTLADGLIFESHGMRIPVHRSRRHHFCPGLHHLLDGPSRDDRIHQVSVERGGGLSQRFEGDGPRSFPKFQSCDGLRRHTKLAGEV